MVHRRPSDRTAFSAAPYGRTLSSCHRPDPVSGRSIPLGRLTFDPKERREVRACDHGSFEPASGRERDVGADQFRLGHLVVGAFPANDAAAGRQDILDQLVLAPQGSPITKLSSVGMTATGTM